MASSIFTLNGGVLTVGAQSLFPDGTTAAPSVSFLNTQNMGLYRVGALTLGFAVGAGFRGAFDSSGTNNLLLLNNNTMLGFSTGGSLGDSTDTRIARIAAGVPGSHAVGGSTQTGGFPVSIFTSTTAASNVSTSETDLITYSLPANTLSSNGQKVRITVWGSLANTVNTKTVKVYFGATVVASLSGTTANTSFDGQQITVIRTGATAQVAYGQVVFGSYAAFANATSTPAETLSGAVTIKVTGQSSAASGDVTATAMYVEWVP